MLAPLRGRLARGYLPASTVTPWSISPLLQDADGGPLGWLYEANGSLPASYSDCISKQHDTGRGLSGLRAMHEPGCSYS